MAQPALHFAVGATCMTAVTLAVGPLRRRWYRLGPLAATAGGLWACAPDVDHLWRALSWLPGAGTIGNLEYSHAYSLLANLFFFHGWMDRYLRGRGTIVGLGWVVFMYALFFWLLSHRIAVLEGPAKMKTGGKWGA